jgi:peptide-methionine (S)-S-oxide reductase
MRALMTVVLLAAGTVACTGPAFVAGPANKEAPNVTADPQPSRDADSATDAGVPAGQEQPGQEQIATFGAGCFWCVEAVFQQLKGVISVVSGYSGGAVENPTYEQICTGTTGHAEVCQIRFDPAVISFDDLLEVFWQTHDPTTLNRQGADVGTQYRSVIFYHDAEQKAIAQRRMKQLDEAGVWSDPIVTEIAPLTVFYRAEEYHQNYYRNNPQRGYCQAVIRPKLEKFREVFREKLELSAGERS